MPCFVWNQLSPFLDQPSVLNLLATGNKNIFKGIVPSIKRWHLKPTKVILSPFKTSFVERWSCLTSLSITLKSDHLGQSLNDLNVLVLPKTLTELELAANIEIIFHFFLPLCEFCPGSYNNICHENINVKVGCNIAHLTLRSVLEQFIVEKNSVNESCIKSILAIFPLTHFSMKDIFLCKTMTRHIPLSVVHLDVIFHDALTTPYEELCLRKHNNIEHLESNVHTNVHKMPPNLKQLIFHRVEEVSMVPNLNRYEGILEQLRLEVDITLTDVEICALPRSLKVLILGCLNFSPYQFSFLPPLLEHFELVQSNVSGFYSDSVNWFDEDKIKLPSLLKRFIVHFMFDKPRMWKKLPRNMITHDSDSSCIYLENDRVIPFVKDIPSSVSVMGISFNMGHDFQRLPNLLQLTVVKISSFVLYPSETFSVSFIDTLKTCVNLKVLAIYVSSNFGGDGWICELEKLHLTMHSNENDYFDFKTPSKWMYSLKEMRLTSSSTVKSTIKKLILPFNVVDLVIQGLVANFDNFIQQIPASCSSLTIESQVSSLNEIKICGLHWMKYLSSHKCLKKLRVTQVFSAKSESECFERVDYPGTFSSLLEQLPVNLSYFSYSIRDLQRPYKPKSCPDIFFTDFAKLVLDLMPTPELYQVYENILKSHPYLHTVVIQSAYRRLILSAFAKIRDNCYVNKC